MTEARWYVARAKAGQERVALLNLQRQDFIAYYPMMSVRRRRRGRISVAQVGVFPSYILVNFALSMAAWRSVNGTRGIIRLLSFHENGEPSALPVGEVERLQEREKTGDLTLPEEGRIRRDDIVRVRYGHSMDRIGIVLRTKNERVDLLMDLLGRKVKVTAPKHTLEVIGRRAVGPVR